jgi:uncharacterized protein (TIGR02145 family)
MKKSLTTIITLVAALTLSAQIFVKPTATGTGSGDSWANATTLQNAMMLATNEVWVQAGTYNLSAVLQVPQLVEVYGGFAGTETQIGQRNYAANPTIIDGQKKFSVHLEMGALLDGFTVQNGVANLPTRADGGGVWMNTGARVENCQILTNMAQNYGGGIFAQGDGLVYNTLIVGNRAGKSGSAIYGTTLEVRNSTIAGNLTMDLLPQDSNDIFHRLPFPDSAFLNPAICYGEFTTLGWPGVTQNTYLWSTGETSPSIVTPALTSQTTYSVIVTSTDLHLILEFIFTVHVRPELSLSLNAMPSPANIGETVTLTATGSPAGGTYTWANLFNRSVRGHNSILTLTMPTSNLRYSCTYELNGCPITETVDVVNTDCTPPVAPTSLTAEQTEFCQGESTVLKITGGAINSGQWRLYANTGTGDVLKETSLLQTPVFTVSPTETTTYSIKLQGCDLPETDPVSVTINVLQKPEITGVSTVCQGQTITLSSDWSGGTWSESSSGWYLDIHSTTGVVTGNHAGQSLVIYTAANGCKDRVNVDVLSAPVFITTDQNLCQGATMQNSATYGGLSQPGTWTILQTAIATVTSEGLVTASTVNFGTVTLTFTHTESGCKVSRDIEVRQTPQKPAASISTNICQFSAEQFIASPAGGMWTASSGATIDATSGLLTANTAVTHAVVTYELHGYGCKDTVHIRINPTPTSIPRGALTCEKDYTTATMNNPFVGGTFSSSNTAVAAIENSTTTEISTSAIIRSITAGPFELTYQTPQGCSFTESITLNARPGVISGPRTVGLDQTITLTADLTEKPGTWVWEPVPYPNPFVNVGMIIGDVRGVSAGTTQIQLRNQETGCRDTLHITVVGCATLSFNSTDLKRLCFRESMTALTFTPNGATATKITWTDLSNHPIAKPAGLTFTGNILSGTPTESGIFRFTVETADHETSCPSATVIETLTILDSLKGGQIEVATGSDAICYGTDVRIHNVISGTGGCINNRGYIWEVSLGDQSNWQTNLKNTEQDFEYSFDFVGDIYLRRIYPCTTCLLAPTAYSNIVKVTIHPIPGLGASGTDPFASHSTPNTVCLGAPDGTLTVTSPLGANLQYKLAARDFQTDPDWINVSAGTHHLLIRDVVTGCESSGTLGGFKVTIATDPSFPEITDFTVSADPFISLGYSLCDTTTDGKGVPLSIIPIVVNEGANPTFVWTSDNPAEKHEPKADGRLFDTISKTTHYTLSLSNDAGCVTENEVFIYVRKQVILDHITPTEAQHLCYGTSPQPLHIYVNAHGRNVDYLWQNSVSQPTPVWQDIADAPNNSNYSAPGTPAGETLYRVVVMDRDGVCPPIESDSRLVRMVSRPTTDDLIVENASLCGEGTITLTASASAPKVLWFETAATPAALAEGHTYTTPSVNPHGVTSPIARIYHVELRPENVENCESSGRVPVTATWYPKHILSLANADAARNQTVCQNTEIVPVLYSWNGGAAAVTRVWATWSEATSSWISMSERPAGLTAAEVSAELKGAPTTAGRYRWIITTQSYSGYTCPNLSDTGYMTVKPVPAAVDASVDVSFTHHTACVGANGTLTINKPLGNEYDYVVTGRDWQASPVFTELNPGNYTVRVRYNETNGGCSSPTGDGNYSVVRINDIQTGDYGGTPIIRHFTVSPKDILCSTESGKPMTITPNFTNEGNASTFVWTYPNNTEVVGNVDDADGTLTIPIPNDTTTYILTITNEETGCTTTATDAGNRKTVVIIKQVEVSTANTIDTICVVAGNHTLSAAYKITNLHGQTVTYQWERSTTSDFASFETVATTGNTHSIATDHASNFFYRVRVKNNHCNEIVTGYWHIVVLDIPSNSTISGLVNDTICGAGTVSFTPTFSAPATQIHWYDASENLLGITASGETFTRYVTHTTNAFYLRTFNSNHCGAAGGKSEVRGIVQPRPVLTLTSEETTKNQTICEGDEIISIKHIYGGGATGMSLTWSPTPSGTITAATTTEDLSLSISGRIDTRAIEGPYTWTITTTGAHKCTPETKTGTITVKQTPAPVQVTPHAGTLCIPDTLRATGGEPGTVYYQTSAMGTDLTNPKTDTTLTVTTESLTRNFTFRAYYDGCWGESGTASVEVINRPKINEGASSIFTGYPQNVSPNQSFSNRIIKLEGLRNQTYTVEIFRTTDTSDRANAKKIGEYSIHGYASYSISTNNISGLFADLQLFVPYYYYFVLQSATCGNDTSAWSTSFSVGYGCNNLGLAGSENPVKFGKITYGNNTNTDIEQGITTIRGKQIWSANVQVETCANRTAYNGGLSNAPFFFNADCRPPTAAEIEQTKNSAHSHTATEWKTGMQWFSWCFVKRFADSLCPYPWRVPTAEELCRLEQVLNNREDCSPVGRSDANYHGTGLNQWAGMRYTGLHNNTDAGITPDNPRRHDQSHYWSQTEHSTNQALALHYSASYLESRTIREKNEGLVLRCVKDYVPPGCNTNIPGWGEDLGTITYGGHLDIEENTTIVQGKAGSQVWSAHVQASSCEGRTNQYRGGDLPFNADCRNSEHNDNFDGHYFSWCAVMRFQNELCPYPWRVPTHEDFCILDKNLNSKDTCGSGPSTHYTGTGTNQWAGASYTGFVSASTGDTIATAQSYYWTQTESLGTALSPSHHAFELYYIKNRAYPRNGAPKGRSVALRCVKDCEPITPGAIQTSGQALCNDGTFTTIGSSTDASGGDGRIEYRWLRNEEPITDATSATYTPNQAGTYTRQAKDGLSCTPWATSTGKWVVIVYTPPTLALSSETTTTNQDVDHNTNITAITYTHNNGTVAIAWKGTANASTPPAGITVSSLTESPITISGRPTAIGDYGWTLSMTNTNGCTTALTGELIVVIPRCVSFEGANGCTNNTLNLGTVSFASATTWTVSGNGITQIWSDAVQTTNCNKGGYAGGSSKDGYNADCRSSQNYKGDIFSWCAVARFGNTLCPAPWRVPTCQDLVNLYWVLGGPGSSGVYDKLIATSGTTGQFWGGQHNAYCLGNNFYVTEGVTSFGNYPLGRYWSQTQSNDRNGRSMQFERLGGVGSINSQGNAEKNMGFALRCVKDN